MITIIKNQSNRVVLTLTEKQTLLVCDYVFEFINDTTQEKKIFTAIDESTNTCRYNKFTITESITEDLYDGTVNLTLPGYWSYTVYEMTPSSPVDLDINNAISILETGKVFVKGTDITVPSFELNEDSDTIPSFNVTD